MVIQEVLGVFGSANCMEYARRSFQAEKASKVGRGTFIRNLQRALRDAEVTLDKPQNAAEVVAKVVDISERCVRRNDNQGDAKPILVVALPLIGHRQERGRLVVKPAPPIVPSEEDGSVFPVPGAVVAALTRADGIDNRSDPGRPAGVVASGMIGVLPGRNYPTHVRKLAVSNVRQDVGGRKVDVIFPFRARALRVIEAGDTNVPNPIRCGPDGASEGSVVLPGAVVAVKQRGHGGMRETRLAQRIVDQVEFIGRGLRRNQLIARVQTSKASQATRVLGDECSIEIVSFRGRGGSRENELMGRCAGALVGLEHEIRPAVLLRHRDVGRDFGSLNELKLRIGWTVGRRMTARLVCAIHLALIGGCV